MFGPRINWPPIILVLILIASIIMTLALLDFELKSSILAIARSKAQIQAVEKINQIVAKKIVAQIQYTDIVYVHKDEQGRVVLIQPNTIELNRLMTETMVEVTRAMSSMQENTISIPLGQLTGSRILAGYGPKIKVKTIPVSQINVNLLNKFEQAAINQSRHLIYFQIEGRIKVAVPFLDDEVKISTTIPLAETIIVGEVPKTYVNFSGSGSGLNSLLGE